MINKIGIVKVEQGKALIKSNVLRGTVEVSFTGSWVWPVIHKAEIMDISVKTMEIDRRGSEGLICQDNIRADIKVTFFVRVNKTQDDVIKVAQAIGCDRASNHQTLEALFAAKFSEALKTAGKRLDFEDLYTMRNEFRDMIIEVIGTDLNGYSLEDCAIDYLEQTPVEQLDPNNILDAQGIRKITDLTAREHVSTNQFRRNEEKSIKKEDVEAREAILEMERQQADAEARQKREIESVKAREEAETLKIQAEERLKSEQARLKTDEAVAIQEENLKREVQVAEKNRERVIAVETERVEKERAIEVIARERETELQRIAKDKEVEREKREIANVVRERVAVDKTVAEEEEAIKRLRVVEEAKRTKEATILAAEAEAEEALVKDIKKAEASEQSSRHEAKRKLTLAEADLEAADKQAQAKIRMADGIKAEAAAPGLAEVQVKEADAVATEKMGLAEARVKEADADASRKVGVAAADVKERDAEATEKAGLAEAEVLRRKGLAEAEAVRAKLESEADGLRAKLEGEAEGLRAKAESMKVLDTPSREHEEYRLRLDTLRDIEKASIAARERVAEVQAEILSKGLEQADIDIVGGDGVFLDRLVGAVSWNKATEAFMQGAGGERLMSDLKDILERPAFGSKDVANLSLAAVLHGLMRDSDGSTRERLGQLLDQAQRLQLADKTVGELREG
ncbi:MAG: flotillin family protein [Acidobacteriota bacterium]